jgi:hypothetical protein
VTRRGGEEETVPEPTPPTFARATPSGLELLAPPPGLTRSECWWIEQQAASAGGLTAAFRHLVRLRILSDALEAYEHDRAEQLERSGRVGLSPAMRRRVAREWARTRAASAMGPRWHNLMAWRRPGEPGGHGVEGGVDDPAVPLPPEIVRRLIAEGRRVCDEE